MSSDTERLPAHDVAMAALKAQTEPQPPDTFLLLVWPTSPAAFWGRHESSDGLVPWRMSHSPADYAWHPCADGDRARRQLHKAMHRAGLVVLDEGGGLIATLNADGAADWDGGLGICNFGLTPDDPAWTDFPDEGGWGDGEE